MIEKGIMDTVSELKKFDAVLRMTRFSTKRKGNDKKRISKKMSKQDKEYYKSQAAKYDEAASILLSVVNNWDDIDD